MKIDIVNNKPTFIEELIVNLVISGILFLVFTVGCFLFTYLPIRLSPEKCEIYTIGEMFTQLGAVFLMMFTALTIISIWDRIPRIEIVYKLFSYINPFPWIINKTQNLSFSDRTEKILNFIGMCALLAIPLFIIFLLIFNALSKYFCW